MVAQNATDSILKPTTTWQKHLFLFQNFGKNTSVFQMFLFHFFFLVSQTFFAGSFSKIWCHTAEKENGKFPNIPFDNKRFVFLVLNWVFISTCCCYRVILLFYMINFFCWSYYYYYLKKISTILYYIYKQTSYQH